MKLIVGLGNPGRKYEQTRHNVGFVVAAIVASRINAGPSKSRFDGDLAEGTLAGEKLAILWPQTFMNASGRSARKACDFYKVKPEDMLVICDDLNLASGRVRLRATGSAGGQKGVADIIRHLGTEEFPRLRIGIDRPPPGWDVSGYVLGKFTDRENEKIELAVNSAAQAVLDWARDGIGVAMNRYNAAPQSMQRKSSKSRVDSPDKTKSKPSESADPSNPSPDQD